MLSNFFKIKFRQFLAIVIISAPLGYFIYQNNADKVNYVVLIKAGKLVSENYCNSYVMSERVPILSQSEYASLESKFKAAYLSSSPSYKGNVVIGITRDRTEYQAIFGGKIGDIDLVRGQISPLVDALQVAERKSFKENFENLKLYCDNNVWPVFKYVPALIQDPALIMNNSYSRMHVLISALSPFIFLYFLLIAFNYIKLNFINLVARD